MFQTRPLFTEDRGQQGWFSIDKRQCLSVRNMRLMLGAALFLGLLSPLLLSGVLQDQAQKYLLPGVKERPRDKHGYQLSTNWEVGQDMTIVLTHGEFGTFTRLVAAYVNFRKHSPRAALIVCAHSELTPPTHWQAIANEARLEPDKVLLIDVPLSFLHRNAARIYCTRGVRTRFGVFVTTEVEVNSDKWLHMIHSRMTVTDAPALSIAPGPRSAKTEEEPCLGLAVKGGDDGFVRVREVLEGGSGSIPWPSGEVVVVRAEVLYSEELLRRGLFVPDVPSRWEMLDLYLSIYNVSGLEPYGASGEGILTVAERPPLMVRDVIFITLRTVDETHDEVASRLRDRWHLPFSIGCWERLRTDHVLQGLVFENQTFPLDPYTHAGLILSLLVVAGNNRFRVSSMHREGPGADEVEHVFHGNASSTIKYVHGLYNYWTQLPAQQQQRQGQQGGQGRMPAMHDGVLSLSILNPHQVRKSPKGARRKSLALQGSAEGGVKEMDQQREGGAAVNGTSDSWAKATEFAAELIKKGQASSQERCLEHGGTYPDFMFVRCLISTQGNPALIQHLDSAASMVILRPVAGQFDYWLWLRGGSAAAVASAYEQGRSRWIALGQRAEVNCYQPHEHDAVDLPVSFSGQGQHRSSRLMSWAYRPLTGTAFEELWENIAQSSDH